jgi:hypothetical protein
VGRDEEGEFCPRIDANLREGKLRLFVVSALPIQHPALFCIGEEWGIESAERVLGSREWDVGCGMG